MCEAKLRLIRLENGDSLDKEKIRNQGEILSFICKEKSEMSWRSLVQD